MPPEKYPHTILIVEDEAPMMKTLLDNLRGAGFEKVLEARDGEEGLAAALREAPDLIVLDIMLPKLDGMAMLKKLREDPRGKKLKVVLLTNLSADESITKGVAANEPSYYLVKTEHSIDDVVEKVKDVLGTKPA